jgi:choline kinase
MLEIDGRTVLSRLIEALAPKIPTIHVVIGYREEMVIEYCARHHRNIVLVRNPDYMTTNTAYSLAKGANLLKGKVLFMDGDLLVSRSSIAGFIDAAAKSEILVGLTNAKSENAVLAIGKPIGDVVDITGFSRETKSEYEWANIVAGPADLMDGADGYVFERLTEHLPLPGRLIELSEIDTKRDLEEARKFLAKGGH